MNISSRAFRNNGVIPKKYTCEGEDVCPPLQISKPPAGTKSFCILVRDPDASSGDFVHWLIWNIKPDIRNIEEGTTPVEAVEGTTDFGRTGWGGPCPPSGRHRYEFQCYALRIMLDLRAGERKEDVRNAINGNILAEASLSGLYEKNG